MKKLSSTHAKSSFVSSVSRTTTRYSSKMPRKTKAGSVLAVKAFAAVRDA